MLTPAVDLSMVHCGFADAEEVDSVVFIAVTVVLLHDAVAVDVLAAEVLWLSMDFKIQKMSYKHTQNKCYKKSAHSKNQRQVYTMSSMRRILSSQQKKIVLCVDIFASGLISITKPLLRTTLLTISR